MGNCYGTEVQKRRGGKNRSGGLLRRAAKFKMLLKTKLEFEKLLYHNERLDNSGDIEDDGSGSAEGDNLGGIEDDECVV